MSGPAVYTITIPGRPQVFHRPRWNSSTRATFNSTAYSRWKKGAAQLMRARKRELGWPKGEPLRCAVAVSVDVVLARPKRKPAAGLHRDMWHPTNDYPYPMGGRHGGDADNYLKAALDALQDGGIIADDHLVVSATVTKYAGTTPGVDITIHIIHPEPAD